MILENYSVTVTRSHDYCHFSVTLGGKVDAENDAIRIAYVDEIRKTAARLADKAVSQYKIAKANAEKVEQTNRQRRYDSQDAERISKMAETDRTPEDMARLKAHNDRVFEANRRYDYDDDWVVDEEDDQ